LTATSDDKYLIAGSLERSITIYDIRKEKIKHEIRDPHYGSSILSIVTNDEWVISSSTDGSIKIFGIVSREEVHCFENIHEGNHLELVSC
jgi:WD40 repeat protein